MGVPSIQRARIMQFSIIASLAFIAIATALPSNEVVPEDNFYAVDDDLSEARETLSQMQAAGKSDKDCRKLVDETKKEINTNVNTNQKVIDGLPDGSQCMNLGQDNVKKTTELKIKADKDEKTKCDEVKKAASASVDFGSRTFSSLTVGKCSSFYSSSAYTTAKTRYTSAVAACNKAKGAAAEAAKAVTSAKAAAEKAKNECLCKTKKDHEKAFTDGNAANAANAKAWAFAHHLECVLDGKTACRVPAPPTVTRGKLTGAAKEAKCSPVITPRRI